MSTSEQHHEYGYNQNDISQEEESNEPFVIDYGNQFSRARYTNNQAERSIGSMAQKQGFLHHYVSWQVAEGTLKPEELKKIEKEKKEMAVGIHTYAQLKERYPFIDTKSSSDLGTDFSHLPFIRIVDEDMEKLAHEVELGNSITPLGEEQRAAAYGFLEQHEDIDGLTFDDFQDINSSLEPCVIPNLFSSSKLKAVAESLGYTPEIGKHYVVRRRTDFTEALERALQRNYRIEQYVEAGQIAPKVAIAFGNAMQEFSCIRAKVTTRSKNQTTNYSPAEIIHKFFKKGGMYITQGLPLLHIAEEQNDIARNFFDPNIYKFSSNQIDLPHRNKLESLNGVLAPCVIANLITGVRIAAQGEQMLK